MRMSELVMAGLLCLLIVVDVPIPTFIMAFIGSMPGLVLLLGIVFYLFTQSPMLGVLSFVAAYSLVQKSGMLDTGFERIATKNVEMPSLPNVNMDGVMFTPSSQFSETLEESVVKNVVPLVRDMEGPFFNVSNFSDDTHNASVV
jgi:hypothetical protein